jgi:hypothetical protein
VINRRERRRTKFNSNAFKSNIESTEMTVTQQLDEHGLLLPLEENIPGANDTARKQRVVNVNGELGVNELSSICLLYCSVITFGRSATGTV